MIGSSPDVIMTDEEWHVGVFRERKLVRQLMVQAFWHFGIHSFEPLRRHALKRTIEIQRADDLAIKSDAKASVIKLMDYHIVFSDMIRRSFAQSQFVNLARHPYGQCESLMRSGLSLKHACRWYSDVARIMIAQSGPETLAVRFEDVVTRPLEVCDRLYRSLGVRWPTDKKINVKVKPYGAQRTADVDVSQGEFIRVEADDIETHIDASVLRGEKERLSDLQRKAIWDRTGQVAAHFGYTEAGSCWT